MLRLSKTQRKVKSQSHVGINTIWITINVFMTQTTSYLRTIQNVPSTSLLGTLDHLYQTLQTNVNYRNFPAKTRSIFKQYLEVGNIL